MIQYQEEQQQLNLYTENNQLSIGILPSGHVVLLYFGKKITSDSLSYITGEIKRASYLADTDSIKDFKLEQLPFIYPAYGNPDLRTPAFQFTYENGSRISDYRYKTHRIYDGKKKIPGLPSTNTATKLSTLELVLKDEITSNEIMLSISCFDEYDIFTQHVEVFNYSKEKLKINQIMSVNLDFLTDKFDLITLSGAWGRESHIHRNKIRQGYQGIDSKRGASGHGQNPFIALVDPSTNENSGNVYSMNFIYSGNFIANVEVDMHQNTRMQLGINPFDFEWCLSPGEVFYTPEAVLVFSNEGLNGMSQLYHRFYLECLMQSNHARKERPVLINNWEATYFDFNKETILSLAKEASEIGIELFVLDDGWFGERNGDNSSLGDWVPNEKKLGGSLKNLIKDVNKLGLDFGLWLEPEMISRNSNLFKEHPDWIIQVPGRVPQQVRNQLVLDLSRKDVQNFLIETIDSLLKENNITYLKWDMNRNLTDMGSILLESDYQKELGHRYILGLYFILETLLAKHPDVLIESCAGGGGRFDPGMLYYTPQIWTSDNTDAIERLATQEGISLLYPPVSMSCHVSAVPNHQVGRMTTLNTRGIVAQQGNFGYEINLLDATMEDKLQMKLQIEFYKKYRNTFQFGQHYRLNVYDEQNEKAWMKLDAKKVIVSHVYRLAKVNTVPKRLKLQNLEETASYRLEGTKRTFKGDELMEIGIALDKPTHDFYASQWVFTREK
ncbi:alpha-galactosidase [Niallia sp. Man26]|uniref:alpha-galactosidase n=1 Tax=Niallia sp. Man26 TaxID=2912824 RepID=UPI001EDB587D|nr:alpha-galactosidase [Niallia sp. Man26]UPO90127.1 alpha-galactosidase [Niallia sp. Man26]